MATRPVDIDRRLSVAPMRGNGEGMPMMQGRMTGGQDGAMPIPMPMRAGAANMPMTPEQCAAMMGRMRAASAAPAAAEDAGAAREH